MGFQFEMTFTSYSQQTLNLGFYYFHQSGHDNGQIGTAPENILKAGQGYQVLSVSPAMGDSLAENELDLACTWVLTGTNPLRFGVKMHFPVQILGMGTDPYWYVMYDQNAVPNSTEPEPDWQHSGKHPGDPYDWPEGLPLKISATPQASGSGLLVNVLIQDPPMLPLGPTQPPSS